MTTSVVTGASGLLGTEVARTLLRHGHHVVGTRLGHAIEVDGVESIVLDVTDAEAVHEVVAAVRPALVVHTAGITDVDACERDESLARRVHVDGSRAVAAAAAAARAELIHISTDHLWGGDRALVAETDPPAPVNAYARTKLGAERAVLDSHPAALVVRTNFFGPGHDWHPSLSDWISRELSAGRRIRAFADVHFTPIHVGLLAELLLEVLERGARGVLHVAGGERVSKHQFALAVAAALQLPETNVVAASIAEADLAAPRPRDMSLNTDLAASILDRPLPDVATSVGLLAESGCDVAHRTSEI